MSENDTQGKEWCDVPAELFSEYVLLKILFFIFFFSYWKMNGKYLFSLVMLLVPSASRWPSMSNLEAFSSVHMVCFNVLMHTKVCGH